MEIRAIADDGDAVARAQLLLDFVGHRHAAEARTENDDVCHLHLLLGVRFADGWDQRPAAATADAMPACTGFAAIRSPAVNPARISTCSSPTALADANLPQQRPAVALDDVDRRDFAAPQQRGGRYRERARRAGHESCARELSRQQALAGRQVEPYPRRVRAGIGHRNHGCLDRRQRLVERGDLDADRRVKLQRRESRLRHRRDDAQLTRIEDRDQRPARLRHVAELRQRCADHAGIGRRDRCERLCGNGLAGIGGDRRKLRLRSLVFGFRLVERGLAHEFLRDEVAVAFVFALRIGKIGVGFRDLRAPGRDCLVGAARVDARQHLSCPYAVARLDVERNDATRHLRAQRRLPDRLDLPLGGKRSWQLTNGDVEGCPDGARGTIVGGCGRNAGGQHDGQPERTNRVSAKGHRLLLAAGAYAERQVRRTPAGKASSEQHEADQAEPARVALAEAPSKPAAPARRRCATSDRYRLHFVA